MTFLSFSIAFSVKIAWFDKFMAKKLLSYLLVGGKQSVFLYFCFSQHPKKTTKSFFFLLGRKRLSRLNFFSHVELFPDLKFSSSVEGWRVPRVRLVRRNHVFGLPWWCESLLDLFAELFKTSRFRLLVASEVEQPGKGSSVSFNTDLVHAQAWETGLDPSQRFLIFFQKN